MQLRRWIVLVGIAPGLMLLFVVLFGVGDQLGFKDTPAVRFSYIGTSVVACLTGWLCARRMPVRHAVWLLPVGVGVALALWLPTGWPAERSTVVAVAVLLTWIAALVVVSVAASALAKRSPLAATLFAVVGALIVVASVPVFAVRLGVGAGMLTPDSLAVWTPAVLTDETFSLDLLPRHAAEIASMFAVLVTIGTGYVIGYVIGLGRTDMASAPTAIGPQPAS